MSSRGFVFLTPKDQIAMKSLRLNGKKSRTMTFETHPELPQYKKDVIKQHKIVVTFVPNCTHLFRCHLMQPQIDK